MAAYATPILPFVIATGAMMARTSTALFIVIAATSCGPRVAVRQPVPAELRAAEKEGALPADDVVVLSRDATIRPVVANGRACLQVTVERELLLRNTTGRDAVTPFRLLSPAGVELTQLAVATLTADGRELPAAPTDQREGPAWRDGSPIPGAIEHVVELPSAGPGARIRTRYQQRHCQMPVGTSWFLQERWPVLRSTLTLVEPPNTALAFRPAGSGLERPPPPDTVAFAGGRAHRFVMERVTPHRDEPHGPPLAMEGARIDVTVADLRKGGATHEPLDTWSAAADFLRGLYAEAAALPDDVKLPRELRTRKRKPGRLLADRAVEHVQEEIRTLPIPPTLGALRPAPAAAVLERLEGTPADKAAVLYAILERIGFAPELVFLGSAAGSPIDPAFPRVFGLDRILVRIEGDKGPRFLDPLATGHGAAQLPPEVQGLPALLVRLDAPTTPKTETGGEAAPPEKSPLVTIPFDDLERNRTDARANLLLTKDGSLSGMLELTVTGQRAVALRRAMVGYEAPEQRARLAALLWPDAPPGFAPITKIQSAGGLLRPHQTVRLALRLDIPRAATQARDVRLLSAGLAMAPLPPSFTLPQRTSGLLFPYGEKAHLSMDVTLPRGVNVELPPEALELANPYGTGEMSWTQKGRTLKIECTYERPALLAPPTQYTQATRFFRALRTAWLRRLVLRG